MSLLLCNCLSYTEIDQQNLGFQSLNSNYFRGLKMPDLFTSHLKSNQVTLSDIKNNILIFFQNVNVKNFKNDALGLIFHTKHDRHVHNIIKVNIH